MVNISTSFAFEPSAIFPISSSLRSALAGFTKLYANRYAAEGIRMNNLQPGFIETFYEVDEQTRASIPMRRGARSRRSRRPGHSFYLPMHPTLQEKTCAWTVG
jgi:NAD(P)-dependent dehydrogenase (short-subunit alcohol dehydrogenase family)